MIKYFYDFITSNMNDKMPKYKQTGINYIKFAKEENNIFKVLFMSKTNLSIREFIDTADENFDEVEKYINMSTSLTGENLKSFHVKMWLFTHGLATLIACKAVNLTDEEIISFFDNYPLAKKYLNNNVKNSIHIKVYSNFLKDTAESMGFTIDDENYDYVVYPDYLADEVQNETQTLIEISSHNFVSKNPFVRLEKRYEILEKLI